jgi:hypothetical protein
MGKGGAEKLAQMKALLRDRLSNTQYELWLRPDEQIARPLGRGLASLAKKKPLILSLDTYEIVDQADFWLREVINIAGPRLVWVIAGRKSLVQSGPWGGESYFRGYVPMAKIIT